MGLKKCQRCELNYILDDGDLCTVCREEVRGTRTKDEATLLCSVCGEVPALPGEDMCRSCLSEIRSIEVLSTDSEEDTSVEAAEINPDPVSSLDEIEGVGTIDDDEEAGEDEEDADMPLDEMDALDTMEA